MKHATLITLFGIAVIVALSAYLKNPIILVALAFIPYITRDLPYGLLSNQQTDMPDDFDEDPQPMGFTQEVKSK